MSWRSWPRSWPGLCHRSLTQGGRSCFQAQYPPPCCSQGTWAPHLRSLFLPPSSCPSPEQRTQGSQEAEPSHSQKSHTRHGLCSGHPVTRSTRDKTGGDYVWARGYHKAGNAGLSWSLPPQAVHADQGLFPEGSENEEHVIETMCGPQSRHLAYDSAEKRFDHALIYYRFKGFQG